LAEPFLFNRTDRVFFRASARKTKNKNSSRNPGDTMGVSGYCSFFCLWAVRARSARGRVFTEPWATSPTAGAMKIEQGVVYNPIIHHWLLVRKKLSSWAPLAMASTAAYAFRGRSARGRALTGKSSGGLCIILFILINILFILINKNTTIRVRAGTKNSRPVGFLL
jgi:hypothetical protein